MPEVDADMDAMRAYVRLLNEANKLLLEAYTVIIAAEYDALAMGAMVAGQAVKAAQLPAIEWIESNVDPVQPEPA